jgi:hypothetical protein
MNIMNFPLVLFVCSLIVLWVATRFGALLRKRGKVLQEDDLQDLNFVTGAVLTLLGLLIGFSFSMAISRYDQRKNYEEEEANAIGTEYVRTDFLPGEDAAAVRGLLRKYLDQRVLFYQTRNPRRLDEINAETARLQNEMWSKVRAAAAAQPNPVMAVVVSGMNDVLNTQGYTQAAWWNRIPLAAWGLMAAISIGCSMLIGLSVRHPRRLVFVIVPVAVSISFLLIADIDSPRGGLILVTPQNLLSLSQSLQSQ